MPGVSQDATYSTYAHTYAQVTVTTAAQSLSALVQAAGLPGIPTWATMAFITPETGAIRYRCDGTAPTSSVGQPVQAQQSFPIQGATSLSAAQLIAAASTTVSIEFRG